MRKHALIPISVLATSLPRHMINTLLKSCHLYQLLLVPALSVHINVSLFSSSAFTYWLHSGPWLSTGTNISQKRSTLRTPPKKMVMLPLFFPLFFLCPYKQGQKVSWFSFSAWISKNGSTTMGKPGQRRKVCIQLSLMGGWRILNFPVVSNFSAEFSWSPGYKCSKIIQYSKGQLYSHSYFCLK